MIIAIESVDAGGKATQTKLLVDRLKVAGAYVESMSFPNYGTKTGKLILAMLKNEVLVKHEGVVDERESAMVLQSLMTMNRYEQIDKWRYMEHRGSLSVLHGQPDGPPFVLVLDRYWISGLVYGTVDGLDPNWLMEVHAGLPPAQHILLDVDPAEALRRRPEARDRFERDREKQVRVAAFYKATFVNPPQVLQGRVSTVNGMQSVEGVAKDVWQCVSKLLPLKSCHCFHP